MRGLIEAHEKRVAEHCTNRFSTVSTNRFLLPTGGML